MKQILMTLFFLAFWLNALPQQAKLYQNIRGKIKDAETQLPLEDAMISIENLNPVKRTNSSPSGEFHFLHIPVGHYRIRAQYIGYEVQEISDLYVEAGHEAIINIALKPIDMNLSEIIVVPINKKSAPLNPAAVVSAIQFSVEETSKFSGSINDPSRMVSAFPGITSSHDADNQIIVRGNSPKGLQWRIEDVEVPNPNHFSDFGATGGTVSMLSSFMMGNSDFLSGTFPTEYGNATSGIFDIHLRNGNDMYNEFDFQAGILGLVMATEGPLRIGENSSYLINYRYSTLNLLSRLGINIAGDAIPDYQDLAFKFNIPTKKTGNFDFWGLGGLSKLYESLNGLKNNYGYNLGIVGIRHKYWIGKKIFIKNSISLSGTNNHYELFNTDSAQSIYKYRIENLFTTLHSSLNYRYSPSISLKTGFDYSFNPFKFAIEKNDTLLSVLNYNLRTDGHISYTQAFTNLKYQFAPAWTTNIGIHLMYFSLNNKIYPEPRANLKWQIHPRHSISFGYADLHRSEPAEQYFYKTQDSTANTIYPNKNLNLMEANHFSLAYTYNISTNLFYRTEIYYQYLSQLPVKDEAGSPISTINTLSGLIAEPLVNKGIGINKGIEMMLQKFYEHGTYYLISVSLFESHYKGNNTPWYSTAFDNHYAIQVLGGREINISDRKMLAFSARINSYGGRRYTPIDLQKSIARGYAAYREDSIYGAQAEPYFRIDFQFRYVKHRPKWTGEWRLDIQNLTNHLNMFGIHYNNYTQKIEKTYQLGMIPIISYRVSFMHKRGFYK